MQPKDFYLQAVLVPYHTCVCALCLLGIMAVLDLFLDGILHTIPMHCSAECLFRVCCIKMLEVVIVPVNGSVM